MQPRWGDFRAPLRGPSFRAFTLSDTYAGFVDAGFLHAEGAKAIGQNQNSTRLRAREIVEWLRGLTPIPIAIGSFLRAYWYDGAFSPNHPLYGNQRRVFDAIARTPGIQLRLGHIAQHPSRLEHPIRTALKSTARGLSIKPDQLLNEFDSHWKFRPERHQKGVDTLIALDMVRLAGRSAFSTAILIAGDRDLAEVVRTTQDFGVRTLVATPNRSSLATELSQLADEVIEIEGDNLKKMLT